MSYQKGRLYLIPNLLGENGRICIEETVKSIVSRIDYYIVENEKPARRFIKAICPEKRQQDLKLIQNNKHSDIEEVMSFLKYCEDGIDIGLLSDAGLPCIADPGRYITNKAHQRGIEVNPLVGGSSIFLALMASGFNGQHFSFKGYLPIKKERKGVLLKLEILVESQDQTQILMETPYRNVSLFDDMLKTLKDTTKLCVACNITMPNEYISTKTIKKWKKYSEKNKLHKTPAIFLIGQ